MESPEAGGGLHGAPLDTPDADGASGKRLGDRCASVDVMWG